MSSLRDKASSEKSDGRVNMPSPRRTSRWARFSVALAMLLGHVFADGAGWAVAQDQRELARAQCEEGVSTKSFSIQERWAWGQICAGKPANMADYPDTGKDNQPNCNPTSGGKQAGRWLNTQILSPEFIEFIATHPRYTQVAAKRQARVECAIVNGQINLSSKKVRPELIIAGSALKGGINMTDARFLRSFSIERSSVTGIINAAGATFDRNFTLKEGVYENIKLNNARIKTSFWLVNSTVTKTFTAQAMDVDSNINLEGLSFMKEVNLNSAKTAGALDIEDSTFQGEFEAGGLDAGGGIFLENASFEQGASLNGAKTAGVLGIIDSKFQGVFVAEGLDAGGGIFLWNAGFKRYVSLYSAKTARQLRIDDSKFQGVFVAEGLDAGGGILLRNASFEQGAFLNGAKTAGALGIEHSTFQGEFEAEGLDAGGGILLRNASFEQGAFLNGAKTAGALGIIDSKFQGEFKAGGLDAGDGVLLIKTRFKGGVNLSLAKVNGMLQLASSSFADELDLSHAHIANALILYGRMGTDDQGAKPIVPLWKKDAELILDHSYAGVLQARMPDSWLVRNDAERPSTLLARSLNGFVYDSLDLAEDSELEDEKIRSLIKWAGGAAADHEEEETFLDSIMRNLCLASEWQQEETQYKPQPYTQLAEKLYEIGATDQADRVLIARSHHDYGRRTGRLDKITGCIRCFVTQYGIKPARPLYLFLILVALWAPINCRAYSLYSGHLRKCWTARELFGYACRLFRSPLPALASGFWALFDCACWLCRPLFYSFRNSIPLPGFLSFTKEARQPARTRLICLLYAQKIIALILLTVALGDLVL